MIPTLEDIEAARERIRGIALRTPLVRLNVPDAPAEIYLKLESLQPIGSFKIRGAANAMGRLAPEELARGVLTASAGNMAQGVAWCARARGIPCTVVAPETAPATKIAAIERLGGRVIKVPFERWWETFETRRYPGVDGTFIHAFDDPHVMAGNGTIGLEMLEDLPDGRRDRRALGRRRAHLRHRGGGARAAARVPRLRRRGRDRGAALRRARGRRAAQRSPTSLRSWTGSAARSSSRRCSSAPAGSSTAPWSRRSTRSQSAVRLLAERNRVVAEGAGACPVACALSGRRGSGTDRVHRVRRQHRPRPLRVARRPDPTPRAVSQAHAFAGDLQAADTSRARSVL